MKKKQCILEKKSERSMSSSILTILGWWCVPVRVRDGERANEDEDGCLLGVLNRLLDDGLLGRDVLGAEVLLRVLGQPNRELGELLTQALGSLEVHVGLSKQLREEAYTQEILESIKRRNIVS
jgi:hypothetical protein